MPLPTTLLEFATGERSHYQNLADQAEQALASARDERTAARETLRTHAEELSEARSDTESLRERLAAADTPGDAEDLVDDLVDALMRAREAMAGVHESRAEERDAASAMEAASARLSTAERGLEEAEELEEWAEEESDLHDRWSLLLSQPPLDTLEADAADLLTGSALSDLTTEVEDGIPEKLRQAALKRRELEVVRRSNARKLADAARDALDTLGDDPAAGEETAYQRKRSELRAYVSGAGDRLARARDLLEAGMPEIGTGEADELSSLAGDGETAAELEIAITEARIDVENLRFALIEARLNSLADPDQDFDVAQKEDDLAEAEADDGPLAVALDNFDTAGHPEALERWELALPDEVWRFFLRFHDVVDDLTELAGLDPSTLESELDDAEEALAGARQEAADARHRREELEVRRRALARQMEGLEEAFDPRVFSAVRGDG